MGASQVMSAGSRTEPPRPAARPQTGPGAQVQMSDVDFAAIARYIHRETGIVITPAKRSMLVSRLSQRLRKLDLPDFRAYSALLDSPEAEDERQALISAITTNVTGFFREPHHFKALSSLMPELLSRLRSGGRVRLWSAACSTGQEAYSIAATVLDQVPDAAKMDLRILATDIDPAIIDEARRGTYDERLIGDKPPPQLGRILRRGPQAGTYAIDPAARALIRFEVLNLLQPWPFHGSFDVIFCRNVVIYFDSESRRTLWARFAQRIPTGGMLFLGHSERMDPQLDALFSPAGVTQYRRTAVSAPPGEGGLPPTAGPTKG